jgi:protein TonB
MAISNQSNSPLDDRRVVIELCLIGTLALCIALTHFWPLPGEDSDVDRRFSSRGQELITIEQILPTRQQKAKPAPPVPLPPVEVPNDELLEDVELELDRAFALDDTEAIDDNTTDGLTTGDTSALPRAHTDAKVVRIVTPTRSREAEKRKIRAEVKVEILVSNRGEVIEAKVVDRYLLVGKEPFERERVDSLGYGLEESAIAAARQTVFRPARDAGKSVESYTSLVFSFGI